MKTCMGQGSVRKSPWIKTISRTPEEICQVAKDESDWTVEAPSVSLTMRKAGLMRVSDVMICEYACLCTVFICVCVNVCRYDMVCLKRGDHQASVYRTSTSFRLGSLALRSSYVSAVSLVLFMFRLHRLFIELSDSRPASVTGVSHRFNT